MKDFILKEYGSWSIMIISFLTGLFVSEGAYSGAIVVFMALSLLINSKQAFIKWITRNYQSKLFLIFASQVLIAASIILIVFGETVFHLLPLLVVPLIYLVFIMIKGEHFILSEIAGFAVLSLSGVIVKFEVTGDVDYLLYLCISVFFIAGVFKVRVQFRKGRTERILMALYVAFSILIYYVVNVPLIVLLPLIDNLIFSVKLYKVKLMVVGWVEVVKGILFLCLMMGFYS